MNEKEFLDELESCSDEFFDWNGLIRTRVRGNKDSVDPIMAVARNKGYDGKNLTEAVSFLQLPYSIAFKIIAIADNHGIIDPGHLKLKAKVINRTTRKYKGQV